MSNGEQFPVGSIVKLKSGGPDMTVKTILGNGLHLAQWFAGKKLEEGRFQAASLEKVEPAPKVE